MKCKVMGIVNVTPDSFSDGGRYFAPEEAVRRVRNMVDEGADIVDLGGESTRPGHEPIGWEEEWSRLEPVLAMLSAKGPSGVRISVDTRHPETAERALAHGAAMINCVDAAVVPYMAGLCERSGAALVVPASAADGLSGRVRELYLDPMIGFGTSREEDLELLRAVPDLARRGAVLVGASRKRIVRRLTGEKVLGKNLGGNFGIAVWWTTPGDRLQSSYLESPPVFAHAPRR